MVDIVDYSKITDGSLIVLYVGPHVQMTQDAVESLRKDAAAAGRPNCHFLLVPDSPPAVQRYWGVWRESGENQGFLMTPEGRFIYYPHPGIAQAHAVEQMQEWRRLHIRYTVREFIYDPR